MTARVGIVGGGQLGRMLALAGANLGLDIGVLDPDPDAPAARTSAFQVIGAYDDPAALSQLAEWSDVLTYEFENVAPAFLNQIAVPVHPTVRALEVGQDRVDEKRFLASVGLETAPFEPVERDAKLITAALERLGGRGILKTRRFGYDGKGQVRLPGASVDEALRSVGDGELVLEGFVEFDAEVSVIGVRGSNNEATYDPALNVHRDGILRTSTVPCGLSRAVQTRAREATSKLMRALDYRGAIGVEFFVVGERLLVNEFAPRVHNSGHWTDGACVVSQFENHMRAVAGLPLGSTERIANATMANLIGTLDFETLERDRVVLYGKRDVRAGRKMGHVTRLAPLSA